MSARKWHKGPPPHVGWWNASILKNTDIWRWWDGINWSESTKCIFNAFVAGEVAKRRAPETATLIKWTDYYPANARVPRIDPRKGAKQ